MEKYGVFISHRHNDWALAGRIFDFLQQRGLQPFLDADSLRQGDFHQTLGKQVRQAPYFLCLLTKHTFHAMEPTDWVYREIKTALKSKREILLLAEKDFTFPPDLPAEIAPISHCHCYEIDRTSFLDVMNRICERDIKKEKLAGVLDWQNSLKARGNIYLTGRKRIERELAPLEDRFGAELVRCIREGQTYTGENRIKFVHMSCYAASILFSHGVDMIDEQAFDRGLMFNIFARLLEDEDFSLEIIINAPGSLAAQDAIENKKLGNSALEAYPEAVFLSSYCNIQRLIKEDPVFCRAYQDKRFRFMVTENVLPYALFQVEYKPGFDSHNHIKVDLYSEGLVSNMDRRCMMIFKQDDPDNYSFFVERYKSIRNLKKSRALTAAHHDQWLKEWVELQEEMNE